MQLTLQLVADHSKFTWNKTLKSKFRASEWWSDESLKLWVLLHHLLWWAEKKSLSFSGLLSCRETLSERKQKLFEKLNLVKDRCASCFHWWISAETFSKILTSLFGSLRNSRRGRYENHEIWSKIVHIKLHVIRMKIAFEF